MAKLYSIVTDNILDIDDVEEILLIQLKHADIVCFINKNNFLKPHFVSKNRTWIFDPEPDGLSINIPIEISKDFDNIMEFYADVIQKNLIFKIEFDFKDKFVLEFFPECHDTHANTSAKIEKIISYYPFINLMIEFSKC